jgi:hypothetical protein
MTTATDTARPAAIQAAMDTATTPTQDVNFHSNVYNRTTTDAAAAAERTLQMAEAMIPAIEAAYGADSIEAADARIVRDRIEDSILDSIFSIAA